MGWGNWFKDESNEDKSEKITKNDDGSSKYESLRANDGDKQDHQHTWINYDKDGNITSGGATPGKSST
jgi:hypothetical protein